MFSVIVAMCLFALSMSISPGPVNLIVLSTGVNHGFKKSMPFVSGATIGFTLLLLVIGLGLATFAARNQTFLNILSYIGSAFIAYMGFQIARTKGDRLDVGKAERPHFFQGFILQWVNPKAWIASLAGVSAFSLANSQSHEQLLLFVSLYFVICYICLTGWALLGAKIAHFLNDEYRRRIFNLVMGTSLIVVALFLVLMR